MGDFIYLGLSLISAILWLTVACSVIETLRDYAIKALVNTVDHLGSVTYKVNDMLDENVEEVTETEFHVSCIEQVVFFFFVSCMPSFSIMIISRLLMIGISKFSY